MSETLIGRQEAVSIARSFGENLFEELDPVRLPLSESGGRTLAAPVLAEQARPSRELATMDGYAYSDDGSFPVSIVTSEIYPEDDPPALGPDEAAPIATGAALPPGATTVVPREDAETDGQTLTDPGLPSGANVHPSGSDVRSGEQLYAAGDRLAPRDTVLLADLGRESVEVRAKPTVGLLATGTEIHEGRQPDRDSAMLRNLIRAWGGVPEPPVTVPDDRAKVTTRLQEFADGTDIVVTTGGTSVGKKDHTVASVSQLGQIRFRGVRIRPGRPVTLGRLPDGTVVLSLPGKPGAALTAATLVGRSLFVDEPRLPRITATMGRTVRLPAEDRQIEYALPVQYDGETAIPYGHSDSPLRLFDSQYQVGRVASSPRAVCADGIVLTNEDLSSGTSVDIVPYTVLER